MPATWTLRRTTPLALLLGLLLAACEGGGTEPTPPLDERAVVLNSLEVSLTVFSTEDPGSITTVGLAPEGSPVTLAATAEHAVVPLGFVSAVAIVDLTEARVVTTIALPPGSGATGVAFASASTAVVANPSRGTVSPVNVVTRMAEPEIAVGTYPQAVVRVGNRVAVLNGGLGPDFQPAEPGSVAVLDALTLEVRGTVTLSGENPGAAAVGPGGRLYVVNSGRFGAADGSLSVVDLVTLRELEHHEGFGEFPYAAAFGPDGLLYVGSFGYGVAVWDPAGDAFVRSPDDAIEPEGIPSVSGLGFDAQGRLYTLRPDCSEPSVANRLGGAFEVDLQVPVGICPIALVFAPPSG